MMRFRTGEGAQPVHLSDPTMIDNLKTKQPIPDTWPVYIHGNVAIARWTHPDGERRIYLIARGDGLFSHDGEYFNNDEDTMCWISDNVRPGLCDSEQIAVKEIHATYPWSRSVMREDRPTKK
jgi:hypothetical protein